MDFEQPSMLCHDVSLFARIGMKQETVRRDVAELGSRILGPCSTPQPSPCLTPPPVLLLVTPIDLSTHAVTHLAQGPLVYSVLHSCDSSTKACSPLTGIKDNTRHQGQSILQLSILAYWTLSGIDSGAGFPQISNGRCHPMEKASWKPIQVWPNPQAIRRKHSIYR